jgi:hypothetical protein
VRPGNVIGYYDPAPVCRQCGGRRVVPVGVYDDDTGKELVTDCPLCVVYPARARAQA